MTDAAKTRRAEPGTAAPEGPLPQDRTRPLAGRSAWLVTDGKPGMEVQCLGVAKALGVDFTAKLVAPGWPWRILAPWGPTDPKDRFGAAHGQFSPPWPVVTLATGRQSIPYVRAVRRAAGSGTFTVVIQNPRTGPGTADLICVPEHDRLRGPNVITTLTAPHTFSPEQLSALRETPTAELQRLPRPRVAVILGGPNAVYKFTPQAIGRLAGSIASLAALGASFLITPSRRTPEAVMQAVAGATSGAERIIWDGTGENPYAGYLALADQLIVTADSVNMTGEACATGRPVHVFEPDGGSAKFGRFHDALRRYGATRPLQERFARLENWRYAPLDSAATIAREIERRWLRQHQRERAEGSF